MVNEETQTKSRAQNPEPNDDQKRQTQKAIKETEEVEKTKKRLRRMVAQESYRITKVIVPICVCMLIVVVSINAFPIYSDGIESVVHEMGFTLYEKKDSSTGSKIGSALLLSLVFLVLVVVVTFIMAIIIVYNFERLMKGFFIFAFVLYFGGLGTAYLCIALTEYNIPIDWITVVFFVWNYTGLGIVNFFIGGPKILKQGYLVILSSNVALVLILLIPDWSAWALLVALALWDCYAVLHETGPLNRIFSATDGKKLPPILYTTAVWVQTSISEDDSELEIGLGDFVFYSILVGKSFSSGDFLTAIICFISILVGLAITLFILLLKNKPLPALPISIALGILANFSTKLLVIPFNDILTERQIFI